MISRVKESRGHKVVARKLKDIEGRTQPTDDDEYAKHIERMKQANKDYLKKNPNSIYKREVDEAGSAIGGGTVGATVSATSSTNPQVAQKATAPAVGGDTPDIAKALDTITQPTPNTTDVTKTLEPVIAATETDPNLANQLKSLLGRVK